MSPEEEAIVCRSKVRYGSAAMAHDVRRRLARRREKRRLYVYQCRACSKWHLAHIPKRYLMEE